MVLSCLFSSCISSLLGSGRSSPTLSSLGLLPPGLCLKVLRKGVAAFQLASVLRLPTLSLDRWLLVQQALRLRCRPLASWSACYWARIGPTFRLAWPLPIVGTTDLNHKASRAQQGCADGLPRSSILVPCPNRQLAGLHDLSMVNFPPAFRIFLVSEPLLY